MILYFSGTGNSLAAARRIAKATGDTTIPMATMIEKPCQPIQDALIGFVFPVYFDDMPMPVKACIEALQLNSSAYYYGVATCGTRAGQSLYTLQRLLAHKGCRLSYGCNVQMAANLAVARRSHITYNMAKLQSANQRIDTICADIRSQKVDTSQCQSHWYTRLLWLGMIQRLSQKVFAVHCDSTRCVHCGICERICPSHNIHSKQGIAIVGDNCAYCLACVHWCPHQAMMIRNRHILQADQYHHPDITLKDMIVR